MTSAAPSEASRWRRLVDRLPGGRLVRQAYVVVGGTVAGQILQLLSTPILSRLYTPDDFGVFAVFFSVVSVGYVIGSLRYELAIALPKRDGEAINVLALALVLAVVTAVLIGAVGLVWGDDLAAAVNVPAFADYVWVVVLALVVAGWYQALNLWAVRKRDFGVVGGSSLTQGAGLAVGQVGLGAVTTGPGGLLFGTVVSWTAGCAPLLPPLWRRDRESLTLISLRGMRRAAARYRRFPLFGVLSGLLNRGALEAGGVALAAIYGPAVAGLFLLGRRLMVAPAVLISTSVQQVYLGESSRLLHEAPQRLVALYRQTARKLFVLSIAPTILLATVSPWAFELIFGPEWREAGVYTQILAPVFLFQVTVMPLGSTFAILERQDLQLLRDAIRMAMVVGGLVLCASYGLSARWAVFSYSVSISLGYVLQYVLGLREVKRHSAEHAGSSVDPVM